MGVALIGRVEGDAVDQPAEPSLTTASYEIWACAATEAPAAGRPGAISASDQSAKAGQNVFVQVTDLLLRLVVIIPGCRVLNRNPRAGRHGSLRRGFGTRYFPTPCLPRVRRVISAEPIGICGRL